MNPLLLSAARPSGWRRIGVTLALAASLSFAFQPTLLMAQATEPDLPLQAKPKPKPPAKKASKVMPSDTVADELNRREAERVTKAAQDVPPAKPAEAKPSESKAEVQPGIELKAVALFCLRRSDHRRPALAGGDHAFTRRNWNAGHHLDCPLRRHPALVRHRILERTHRFHHHARPDRGSRRRGPADKDVRGRVVARPANFQCFHGKMSLKPLLCRNFHKLCYDLV